MSSPRLAVEGESTKKFFVYILHAIISICTPHQNDLITHCFRWSRKLIERASKTQYMDLPSVNLGELRERGIVVRCANFSIEALRSEENGKNRSHGKSAPLLPIVTSDKKTFNIPNDVYNPAFQVSITLYHYPDKCGTKFLCKFAPPPPSPSFYPYSPQLPSTSSPPPLPLPPLHPSPSALLETA